MKTKIPFIALIFLISSCYTYREVDISSQQWSLGEKYKIETAGPTKWHGRAVAFNDSLLTLQTANKGVVPIPFSKIIKIRQGKFANGKTIGLSVATLGVGVFILLRITERDLEKDLGLY